ncbi:MAG: hypothetical protein P4L56_03330 [Candidatus Sulfopaludibacter sp.]|nr:hypothetical protein [Candidatus Sulfopaludibacter sp.]
MASSRLRAALSLLVAGMGLYTALAAALMIYRTYCPVIFWDQWEYVNVAMKPAGLPFWSRVWLQSDESRLVIGKLAGFADLRFFGGRNISLQIELCLIPICVAMIFFWMIRRSGQLRGPALATAVGFIVFCALNPVQVDDLIWYFEVGFVFTGLAAVASFAGAVWHSSRAVPGGRRWISGPLALSLFAALLAEGSRLDGLLVWPILLLLSFSLRFPRKTRVLIGGVASAAVAVYFWRFHSVGGVSGEGLEAIRHPLSMAEYVVHYFGATWNTLLPPGSAGFILSELLAVAAILISIVTALRHLCFRRPKPDPLTPFLAAIMLFTISTAGVTSLGRLRFGVAQAAASRYQCVALLFWAAFATLVLSWAARKTPRPLALAAVQCGLLVLMVASAGRFHAYERVAAVRQVRLNRAYLAVMRDPSDPAAAGALNPAVASMPVWYGYLHSHRLGPGRGELEGRLPAVPAPPPISIWSAYRVYTADHCMGWIDGLQPGVLEPGVVSLAGWAWDKEGRRPPRQIVFASPDGTVAGFGEMAIPREDVAAVVPGITDINTGWEGPAIATKGTRLRAFAVLRDRISICPLSNEVILP